MGKAHYRLHREDSEDRDHRRIQRINEISDGTKSTWLVLVGYLAFCGITLLAVEDADFFLQTRQTDLPLIGVSIPTSDFFIFGPILATALYIYFHLNIIKLWKEVSRPRARIKGETLAFYVRPGLIVDLALRLRGDSYNRARPLDWLSLTSTFFLVYLLGPTIVGYFWIRYWPAHDLVSSLLNAFLLSLTLSVMFASCKTMVAFLYLTSEGRGRVAKLLEYGAATLISIILALITIFKTDAFQVFGFEERRVFSNGEWRDALVLPKRDMPLEPSGSFARFFEIIYSFDLRDNIFSRNLNLDIAQANLREVVLTPLPEDWLPYHTHKRQYRTSWCARKGIDPEVCGLGPYSDAPGTDYTASYTQDVRLSWCAEERRDIPDKECFELFREFDSQFLTDWRAERVARLNSLRGWSPQNRDLRNADLSQASMVAADLRFVNLAGAKLEGVNLEGADLSSATMTGADLSRASLPLSTITCEPVCRTKELPGEYIKLPDSDLELANFNSAKMRRVNLREASMKGIDLSGAVLKFGILDDATLNGADLRDTDFSWASLRGVEFHDALFQRSNTEDSNLSGASFDGADFGGTIIGPAIALYADFSNVESLEQIQIDGIVGNASTLLPAYPDAESGAPLHVWTCTDHYSGVPDLYPVARLWGISVDQLRERQIPWYCQFENTREKTGTPFDSGYASRN